MQARRQGRKSLWLGTAVLFLMYGLALTSMVQKSPTFDEQGFITRGLGYLRGENRQMRVGHPLGLNAISAAFLVNDSSVSLPTGDPSWQETDFHRPSELFLWEIGNNVEHIMFLARLPTIWLGMLLAAVAGRWAWRMSRWRWAGMLALTLIALDPNILASTRLATTDLGLALGAAVAGFTLWRFLLRPSWTNAIIAGIGLGLLQNSKFTALLFIPLFGLVILLYFGLAIYDLRLRTPRANLQSPISQSLISQSPISQSPNLPITLLMLLTAYPLAAFFTLWAAYGFQIGPLPAELPVLPQLAGLTLPLSHHIEQLLDIGGRLQVETPSFLLGQYSDSGWWYYFPAAFLLKTPLPTLILLASAFVLRMAYYVKHPTIRLPDYPTTRLQDYPTTRLQDYLTDAALLIPALGYFTIALTSDINLGYRHLLPILPFLAVFTANSLTAYRPRLRSQFTIHKPVLSLPKDSQFTIRPLPILTLWLLLAALWIYPDYLAYFNVLPGGPNNGWRTLVDSNIDWGQDLGGLAAWLNGSGGEQIWLSYFGEARPEYYGINYVGLDSWPPRLMNPQARPYAPTNPAPGVYAISATNLQGVHFANHDQFAFFRDQDPIAKIGYSIFLYDVTAVGPPVDVAWGSIQPDEIAPQDYALLQSNDVTSRWFDPAQSLLRPAGENRYLAVGKDTAVHPLVAAQIAAYDPIAANDQYAIYRLPPRDLSPIHLTTFRQDGGEIGFVGGEIVGDTAVSGQTLTLVTHWQQQADPRPVKIFIHLLDANGRIAAQWDGLGAVWQGWRSGDRLQQIHDIPLPADLPSGSYQIRAGLYHSDTGQRWLTPDGADFVAVGQVEIGREE
ncbi:MAG: phospholipid carrier-dependent glycosyltransferase [Chloroflexi bacterium]|nr:phospholipid carrier-dependent glycosyltransferase [Chloroflexota bacterium]